VKRSAINRTTVDHTTDPDDDADFGIKAGPVPHGSATRSEPDDQVEFEIEEPEEGIEERTAYQLAKSAVVANEIQDDELEENEAEENELEDDEAADSADEFSQAATRPEEPEPEPSRGDLPSRLGGYEVLRVLGQGGMGSVLLGRQLSLNRKVALKVMHPQIAQNPSFVARFTREAYAAAQLAHHNVVQIYDIGEDKGQHFFSMEFVQGRTLWDMVREQGRLAPEAAVGYVLQAARGVRQGHKQGMVHRDIKPANLLVNDEGIVKVADLGLVKLPEGAGAEPESFLASLADDDVELTGAGMAVGTPAFMAPEQATNSSAVDSRADIYSLGCTLYALVTGRPPFEGKTAPEVMSKHLTEPVRPPETLVKRLPGALSAILLRMLAKDPDERYQSMDEVITALEGFLGLPRSGNFTPSEHETDQLDRLAADYHAKAASGQKAWALIGFALVCAAGVVAAAILGRPVTAVKAFLLLCLVPPAYFSVYGLLSGGVVFTRFRTLVFGMRFFDWFMVFCGTALFLGTLALLGLLVVWLKLVVLALLLGFYFWMLTDRVQAEAQREPLRDGRLLCRMLRGQGLSEEQLRAFVCKYGGPYWEEFFEALFGYEAKITVRPLRSTGEIGGPWKPHASWRDPIVAWADARIETRRLAREQKHLQNIEAKALEAKGVSRSEAETRAEDLAAVLVDQAAEARKAHKAGQEADLRGMVKAARTGKPKPGYNIAGKRLRDLWLRHLLNDWFGRRLRFALGALLLAAGLYWMYQNKVFDKPAQDIPVVAQFKNGEVMVALTTLSESTDRPLVLPVVPAKLTSAVDSYRVPATGLCLLVSALFFFGWRASVPGVVGALIAVLGPALGVPDTGAMSPAMLSLGAGTAITLVGGWLLRK
jgi:serine/threonine protein kinase